MSQYDFIVDNITFSYSSASTFQNCPYCFKLVYIDYLDRQNNFFGQYGTLIHECFEKYFLKEIDLYEISTYFTEQYDKQITIAPPSFLSYLYNRYKIQGKEFFESFDMDRELYDALIIEDKIVFDTETFSFVAKPDLVVRNKETQKVILYDYKTSAPYRTSKKTGKVTADKDKLAGYHKQLYIYAYSVREHRGIPIDDMSIIFTRLNRIDSFPWEKSEEDKVMEWLDKTILNIKKEEFFSYDNSSSFFCNHLCNVRDVCEYRAK